ncbi:restriction endonuclease subunit S [Haemophilus influenzae]|uniref:restriction endonuclease subunit S n=1 Tax=Haemophilus influenzae TaxID=727 RepID=UPI000E59371F|nr:restriction endonuclease subunit S [Haemophilus influenzae]
MAFDIRETAFKLPKNWKLVRLSDIAKVNEKSLTKKSQPNFIRYIDISSVSTGAFDTPKLLKKDETPSRAKRILRNNDFIISTVRPNLKQFSFIEEAQENLIASTGFCVISSNNSKLAWYLYSLITSDLFTEYLVKIADGGAYPAFNPKEIEDAIIPLPDKDNLEFISDTSRFFYKTIQLNIQINQTLEQIAQALFKSWFVDFDPVRAKVQALSDGMSLEQAELAAMQAISGKTPEELTALSQTQPDRYAELAETAKAFPCEMVEVDGVEVPKGWEVKRIDEIANIIKGKSYKSSELEKSKTALVTLKSFNRGGGYRLDGLKEYTGKYKPEQEVFAGELIIAYTDVTQAADVIGKPAMVMSDSNYQHLVISLDVGVVRPFNDVYKHFLYCLAMTDSFQAHTKSFCTGTTVLHLGKDAVPSFEFINPINELLHVFYKQTSPVFEKINLHIEENKNLEKARDLLLPRLLKGEI